MNRENSTPFLQAFSLRANLQHLLCRSSTAMKPVDGLRAISMLMVLFFHAFVLSKIYIPDDIYLNLLNQTPSYLHWVWNGDKGVDVFFVISGFLISHLLFKEHQATASIRLRQFYWRRFLRLTPVYLLGLGVCAYAGGPNLHNIWANIFYVNNFLPMDEMFMPWSWSLAVEEQFYVVFPLFLIFVFFKSERKGTWLIGLFLLSFVVRAVVLLSNETLSNTDYAQIYLDRSLFHLFFGVVYDNLYTRYGNFIAGIYVAYLLTHHNESVLRWLQQSRWPELITVTALLMITFAMSSTLYNPYYAASTLEQNLKIIVLRNLFGAAVAWIILVTLHPCGIISRILCAILSVRFWYPLAQLSYSMYLFHIMLLPFIWANVNGNLKHFNVDYALFSVWWVLGVATALILCTMIVATFTYLLLERPLMNLRVKTPQAQKKTVIAHSKFMLLNGSK